METPAECFLTKILVLLITVNFVYSSSLYSQRRNISDLSLTEEGENNEFIGYSPRERNYRKSKFFPLFTIIRFSNELCRTTAEETGLCYTRSQCSSQGGSAQGSCAQGLGVCCKFIAQCGGIITHNATSFQNPNYPSKYSPGGGSDVCQVRIRKLNNVCQLRLNFIAFDIDSPAPPMGTPGGAATVISNDAGMCKTDSLAVTSSGGAVPSLCGNMGGQHVYVPFGSSDTLTLNLLLSSNAVNKERLWNIEILMIPCNSIAIAPVGCLQYFTGVSGQVQSFNFQGGVHLANMDYSICIRMEDGMRSIDWAACNLNDVRFMPGTAGAGAGGASPTCPATNNDYLTIMGGIVYPLPTTPAAATGPPSVSDRFCDSSFALSSNFVRSTVRPFLIHFRTDGTEQAAAGTAAVPTGDTSMGFCLRWQQNPPI